FGRKLTNANYRACLRCRMKSLAQLLTRLRSSWPFRFPPTNNRTRRDTIFIYKVSTSRTKAARRICGKRSLSFSAPSRKIRHFRVPGLGSRKSGFFRGRSCKTARRLSAIEGGRVEGDCARRKRRGGALLPWRSETNPGLGPDRGGCGIKPRAAARSQLGTRSLFPGATAALPRRAERRARACAGSGKIGSALTDY